VADVGPFPQRGLNEAFGLAVGARSVRASEAVQEAELEASGAERVRAIAASVVGKQAADNDAVRRAERR
jgi:hypothetical protein